MIYSDSNITGRNAIPIVGSAIPKIGMSVCVAGAFRGTSCGYKVVEKINSIKTDSGTFKNMWTIIRSGPCPAGEGDSGSTVYIVSKSNKNTAQALGILNTRGVNNSGNCQLNFTDISEIEKIYGGKILVHTIK